MARASGSSSARRSAWPSAAGSGAACSGTSTTACSGCCRCGTRSCSAASTASSAGTTPAASLTSCAAAVTAGSNIWAINDWSVPVPDGAAAVLIGTRAYFAALARSRYLVYNDHVPLPYRKRRGQRHVQTWHGTPLKRIGYDIGEPAMASGRRYLRLHGRGRRPVGHAAVAEPVQHPDHAAGVRVRRRDLRDRLPAGRRAGRGRGRGGSGDRRAAAARPPARQAGGDVRSDLAGQSARRERPLPARLQARPGGGQPAAGRGVGAPDQGPSPDGGRHPGRDDPAGSPST